MGLFDDLAARNARPKTSHGTTRNTRNNNSNNNNNNSNDDARRSNNIHAAQQQQCRRRDQQHNAAEPRRRQQEDAHNNAFSTYVDDRGNNFLSNNSVIDTLGSFGQPTDAGRPLQLQLSTGLSTALNEEYSTNLLTNSTTGNNRNFNNYNNRNNNNNNNNNNNRTKQGRGRGGRGRGGGGRGGGVARGSGGGASGHHSGAQGVQPLTLARQQQEMNIGGKRPYIKNLSANKQHQPQQQQKHQQQQQQQQQQSNLPIETLQERNHPTNNTMKDVNDAIPKKDKNRQKRRLKDPPPPPQQQQQQQQDEIDLTESDDYPPTATAVAASNTASRQQQAADSSSTTSNYYRTPTTTITAAAAENHRGRIKRKKASGQKEKELVESMEQDDNDKIPIPTFGTITERVKRQRHADDDYDQQDVINVDDSANQEEEEDVESAASPNNINNRSSSSGSSTISGGGSFLNTVVGAVTDAVKKGLLGIKKVNNNNNMNSSGGAGAAGSKKRKATAKAIQPGSSLRNNHDENISSKAPLPAAVAAAATAGACNTKRARNGSDKWGSVVADPPVASLPAKRQATYGSKDKNGPAAAAALTTRGSRSTAASTKEPPFKQRQQPQRKGKVKSSPEIVEINDDSDDDDDEEQQVDRGTKRSKKPQASENSYEAVRIAINGNVFTSDCSVSLKDDGVLCVSCREEPAPTRKTRNTRNKSKVAQSSTRFNLNLDDAVQELKYFLVDDTDGAIDVDADDVLEQDHLSFLFLKFNETCVVSDKASSTPGTLEMLIEFRSDADIKELLKVVGIVGSMAAFTNDGAKLNVAQAKIYGKVLLEHSQEEATQRFATGKTDNKNNKFLQDKDENDTLLVYPIAGGDPIEIDAAANGLHELRGPTRSEYDDAVPIVPVAAAAAATTSSSSEASASDDGTTDAIVSAEAAGAPTALKTGRTHNVTIQVGDYMRLEPEEYLNDSLIDFWMRWIMRNGDNSMMHIFSTHFYTSLVDKGVDGVTNWTAKKNINIFEKKLLFIPINKTLHWSMVVVVNPLHIVTMEKPEDAKDQDPASFILFLDSLKAHQIAVIAKRIRAWLNSEWKRLKKNLEFKRDDPFSTKTMVVYNPKIPYQLNGWDCGVFMCRYAYGLYLLRDMTFSFGETNLRASNRKDRFRVLITESDAFKFTGDDIQRIRTEIKTLIEKLSVIYAKVKEAEKQAKLAKKLAAKLALQAKQDASTAATGKTGNSTAATTTTPAENLQSSQDSSDSTGVLEVGTVRKNTAQQQVETMTGLEEESQQQSQSPRQPSLGKTGEVVGKQLESMMAAASLDDDQFQLPTDEQQQQSEESPPPKSPVADENDGNENVGETNTRHHECPVSGFESAVSPRKKYRVDKELERDDDDDDDASSTCDV